MSLPMDESAAVDGERSETPSFVVIDDPQERERLMKRKRHREMLVMSLVVITLSIALRLNETGNVEAPLGGGFKLPPMCMSRAWFGLECPGCGLTRSFVSLAAGEFVASLAFHRVGWLLALGVVLQVPYRLCELGGRPWPISAVGKDLFGWFLISALLINWGVKMWYQ